MSLYPDFEAVDRNRNHMVQLEAEVLAHQEALIVIEETLGDVDAVVSGTYTPTLTNVANLDASAAFVCQYMRVGSIVTVSGKVTVDPTAGAATRLGISLPIASNLAAEQDCCGTAFAKAIAGQGAAILADATNNRAQMEWIAVDVTNQAMYFTFTYRIL